MTRQPSASSTDTKQNSLAQRLNLEPNFLMLLIVCGVTLLICFATLLLTTYWPVRTANDQVNDRFSLLPSADSYQEPVLPKIIPTPARENRQAIETTVLLETNSQTAQIQIPPPTALQINDNILPIHSEIILKKDLLTGQATSEVRWVQNTIVNYVFQLPPTAETQQLLQAVKLGDPIYLSSGMGDMVFTTSEILRSPPTEEMLQQKEPAITLVWSGSEPLVIYGRHSTLDNESLAEAEVPNLILGEEVTLGEATVIIQDAKWVAAATGDPNEAPHYQLVYLLNNRSTQPLDASWFSITLTDQSGTQYMNQEPPPASLLQNGESTLQTSRFHLPVDLPTQHLLVKIVRNDTSVAREFKLPYTQAIKENYQVSLAGGQFSEDGNILILKGEVHNLGTAPLTINMDETYLQSQDAAYPVIQAEPSLPWLVQPNEVLTFQLHFQRPIGAEATFIIGNKRFALANLR